MKKWGLVVLLVTGLVIAPVKESHAVWWWAVKAAIKKAIKAADLAIQRQQNRVIWLQNAQKVLENTMSKLKLTEISEWTERQRTLYKEYFEELSKVKSLITYYQRIRDIAKRQIYLVDEYKRAWATIRKDTHFTPEEIRYMAEVYSGILEETVKNVDQLALVVNSFSLQMSDAKRLDIINQVDQRVSENFNDLRRFNTENSLLSLKRAKSDQEVNVVKRMYGIQ
jgi:predicted adenine nucleotide alpha hydrolase (AANH) superfamily ATPase